MSLPRIFDHPLSLWDPFQDEGNFLSRLTRLPRMQDDNGHIAFLPPCDIIEDKNSFKVNIELPGISKDGINVSLKEGVLHVEAESSSEEEEKEGETVLRSERRYGKYIRRFNLGKNVSDSDVKATFKDGILNLDIPKQEIIEEEATRIAIA
jgi:HSP20 family protein